MSDQKRILVVGTCVIIVRNNHILMSIRKSPVGKGTWQFPGGKYEPEIDECLSSCAQRETFEETGLHILPPIFLGIYEKDYPEFNQRVVCSVFSSALTSEDRLKEPVVSPEEREKMEDWKWVKPLDIFYGKVTPLFGFTRADMNRYLKELDEKSIIRLYDPEI